MLILELHELHFLLEILIYQVVNLINSRFSNFMLILNKFLEHAHNTFAGSCEKYRIVCFFLLLKKFEEHCYIPSAFQISCKTNFLYCF